MTRNQPPVDVAVAGSGLAACAIALELSRRDLSVALVCRGRAGRPSGPGAPVAAQAFVDEGSPEPRNRLGVLSRDLFPDWLSSLEEETGIPCEYDERGGMAIALDEAEEVLLDRALDAQRRSGLPFEVLEPEEARGREPALTPALHAAFSFPRDGAARAARVGRALVLAARTGGVRVLEDSPGRAVVRNGRAAGLDTPAGILPADVVVLAERERPESWEPEAAVRLPGVALRPWLRLDASADPDRPGRLLVSRGASVLARRDGTMLVFGHAEPDGGGGRGRAGRFAKLLGELLRLVPAAAEWDLVEAGTAAEARSADRNPLIGETSTAGLFFATAWGGDELLLSPAAARLAADLVTGEAPPLPAAAFSPGRFGL